MLEQIREEARRAVLELLPQARLQRGDILVVGCSTSEVAGERIGSASNTDIAAAVFEGVHPVLARAGIFLAAQCCEHLNRALILEREAARLYRLEPVNVVPQPKAGGSFATAAWAGFDAPVAVEHVRAKAGIDIGDTLIGMHLCEVAVAHRGQGPHWLSSSSISCSRAAMLLSHLVISSWLPCVSARRRPSL